MGAAGSPIAIETADIALMQEDWHLVPEALRVARRTMAAVRFNLGFTAVYNLTGLSLAAFGILPPVIAAAAQSLPDFGILANSARLLRQRRALPSAAPTDGSLYPLLARLAPARRFRLHSPRHVHRCPADRSAQGSDARQGPAHQGLHNRPFRLGILKVFGPRRAFGLTIPLRGRRILPGLNFASRRPGPRAG